MSGHDATIGVVGAGVMGRGIAQVFARAGFRVRCFDARPTAAASAIAAIGEVMDREAAKGRAKPEEATATKARLVAAAALSDLSGCDVVIEAIVEELGSKQALLAELEGLLRPTAIFATNTSSLMVSEIGARAARPERVAGLHFFNPVPRMKVVEVIPGLRTDDAVVDALRVLVEKIGHRAVVAADQPGFLINHAGRGLYTEGLRLLEERVAEPAEIDRLLRETLGFRMGPFELMDLTGLDVSGKVMQSIYDQFQQEPRFRPSSLVPPRIAAGWYGRKSGRGWYAAPGATATEAPAGRSVGPGTAVWFADDVAHRGVLSGGAARAGARVVAEPGAADVCVVAAWGTDASSVASSMALDPARTVAVDPLPAIEAPSTVMLTVSTTAAARDAALALLSFERNPAVCIRDSPGFVSQRVIATIVNIAANIVQRGIATVDDLDEGVRLGLGYPLGPLAWGDRIGGRRIVAILEGLLESTGDPRYRPSPWLVRRARLDLSLRHPEPARA